MTTITLTACPPTPQPTALRRLVRATGIALVRWAERRNQPLTHDQQAVRLATERAVAEQRTTFRYGIHQ